MTALAVLVASACLSAPVSYAPPFEAGAPRIPWIHAGAVTGYLFYYGAPGPWKTQRSRVVITTNGGASGIYATKILWHLRGAVGRLYVIGDRIDAPGHFRENFPSTPSGGGTYFPSIVDVPAAGCWRLTVGTGKKHRARFAFAAVEP